MSNLQPRNNSVYYIYNSFKYYLFYAMKERDSYKCWYMRHHKMYNNYILNFKTISHDGNRKYNVSITLETGTYDYNHIDKLINIFDSHHFHEFEISDYDYVKDEFYIIFKRIFHNSNTARIYTYRVCDYGVELKDINEKYCYIPLYERIYNDYIDGIMTKPELEYVENDARCVYDTYVDHLRYKFESTFSDLTANDIRRQLQLPICKEIPTFKFNSLPSFTPVPTLSKPPIFNDPATICYWDDGTKTVVKCQEGDTYSPEAGLALCYMKKVLGNTSKDLNKELHKYIPEEKEE